MAPPEVVPLRRRRNDLAILGSMVCIALLLHAVTMFTWLVFWGTFSHREQFFSERQKVEVSPVTLLAPGALKPPSQVAREGPRPVLHPQGQIVKPRPAPRVAIAARPAPHAADPRPAVARPAPAPHPAAAPNRPAGGVRVVAASHGTSGAPEGSGASTGAGPNVGGPQAGGGSGGGGPQAGLPDGAPGDGGGGGKETPRYIHIHYPCPLLDVADNINLNEVREPRTWEELCAVVRIPASDVIGRPHLNPFLTRFGYVMRRREDIPVMRSTSGSVGVEVAVDAQGRPKAKLARSSGVEVLDATAVLIVDNSHWLPALDAGRPVESVVQTTITFDDIPGPIGIVLKKNEGQAQPPVTRPGGEGQAPVSTPGGAGQKPGSW